MANSERYYAVLPAEKNDETHETLYFWRRNTTRRGIPSDYGWSPLEGDQTLDSWSDLKEKLENTIALDMDNGDCDEDFASKIEIHRIVTITETEKEESVEDGKKTTVSKTVTTEKDELTDLKLSVDNINEIGEEKYGWNGKEPYNICPKCGEDGWQGSNCPNCGYDLH